ncbi:hypothetical protein B0T26DRAFT_756743 [Lasiosphaeria miniovina]|uniref:Zinc finger PHD-type domain-containing protein n=1 Tax=Lasiosphaeria miniovina TaxID=1954250 RepID=A0AA40DJ29_9PEZI|nr:uncharacterized protein B0T26DRAFT_756743 [Lasiosphaeria miniovina]KAK0703176.1 hypothetical protein B0T26DRAFT_756743 [Lasiosphaeria miniovina]
MTGTRSRHRELPFLHRNWIRATNHWYTKTGNNASAPSRKRHRVDNDHDGFPLFEPYATITRALRIRLVKVCHKDAPRVEEAPRVENDILDGLIPPNTNHFRVRCSIEFACRRGDQDVVLHADSQLCEVDVFKNPAGSSPMARFSSIQPFYIPEDKISLEREDMVFGLANSYQVVIRLESGGGINWPPNDLLPPGNSAHWNDGRLSPRQWAFTATIVDLYDRNRKTIRLRLKKTSQGDEMTDFSIDVDVGWFTPVSNQLARGKDIKQSVTVSAPADGEADKLPDPGRTRRPRPEINYNVDHIWKTAVRRQRRKRPRLDDEIDRPDEPSITYLLLPGQVHIEKLACLICGAETERISQLRAHCQSHSQFDFFFQRRDTRTKGELRVRVTPATDVAQALGPRIYQLGPPVKLLDLRKYVEGDFSWVRSRLGLDNDEEIIEKLFPAPPKKFGSERPEKLLVPNIKQALFDPISRAQLVPGAEYRPRPVDDSWLLLKRADSLRDFTDVSPEEKDYMPEWDSFIMRNNHISSEQYLPRVFVGFVKEKADWLVSKRSRMDEFSKHASMLLIRGAIDEASILEATESINEARTKDSGEAPKVLPRHPGTGTSGCNACGKPVPVSAMLTCSNKACKKRLYHVGCVDGVDEEDLEENTWVCGKCS